MSEDDSDSLLDDKTSDDDVEVIEDRWVGGRGTGVLEITSLCKGNGVRTRVEWGEGK